jgi:hypothetical protein
MNFEELREWEDDTLKELRAQSAPSIQDKCRRCGLFIHYPLVMQLSDLMLFEGVMWAAFDVMEKRGITANLLADIRTECLSATAKKRMSETTASEKGE